MKFIKAERKTVNSVAEHIESEGIIRVSFQPIQSGFNMAVVGIQTVFGQKGISFTNNEDAFVFYVDILNKAKSESEKLGLEWVQRRNGTIGGIGGFGFMDDCKTLDEILKIRSIEGYCACIESFIEHKIIGGLKKTDFEDKGYTLIQVDRRLRH